MQSRPFMGQTILLITAVVFSLLFSGCKDTTAKNVAGELEACKILLDDQLWTEAIAACGELDSDEGRHLAAIAYMGRSGLIMASLLTALSDSSNTPTTLIFENIPDTAAKVTDFRTALQKIMGEIEVKDQSMYLEAILLSSLLIFKELKTLLSLTLANGTIGTCAGEPADINNCSFAPRITEVIDASGDNVPGYLVFGGLGSSFYQGIGGDLTSVVSVADTSHDTTTEINLELVSDPVYGDITVVVAYDVTVDSARIGTASPLYYNKTASAAYAVTGTVDLSSLNFYSRMDTGNNFSKIVSPIPDAVAFCNAGAISLPDASDDVISDCEILSFLENPGF